MMVLSNSSSPAKKKTSNPNTPINSNSNSGTFACSNLPPQQSPNKIEYLANNTSHQSNNTSLNSSKAKELSQLDESFSTNYDTSMLSEEDDTEWDDMFGRAQRIRKSDDNELLEYKYDLKEMKQSIGKLSSHELISHFGEYDHKTSSSSSDSEKSDSLISVVTTLKNWQKNSTQIIDSETGQNILNSLMVMDDDDDSATAIMASDGFNDIQVTIRNPTNQNLHHTAPVEKADLSKTVTPSKNLLNRFESVTASNGYDGDNEVLKSSVDLDTKWSEKEKWDLEKKNRDLERRLAMLENELMESQRREKIANEGFRNEKALNEQYYNQQQRMAEENQKLLTLKKTWKERLDSLSETSQQLATQIDKLQTENRELSDTVNNLQGELSRTKEQLKSSDAKCSQQVETIARLEKRIEELNMRISELESQIDSQQKDIHTKSKKIKHQEKDLVNFVKEFDQTKLQFSSFVEKYEKMIEKLERYKKLKHKLAERIESLKQENNVLKENSHIHSPTSNVDEPEQSSSKKQTRDYSPPTRNTITTEQNYQTPGSINTSQKRSPSSTGKTSKTASNSTPSVTPNVPTNISNMSTPTSMPSSNKKSPSNVSTISNTTTKTNKSNVVSKSPPQPVMNIAEIPSSETEEESDGNLIHEQGIPFFKNPTYLRKKLVTERKRVELKNFEIAGLKELLYAATQQGIKN